MPLTKATFSMIQSAPACITDFGAVGDGVTDDTAAVQAAFTWLAGGAYRKLTGGGTGLTYLISDSIVIAGSYIEFDGTSCSFKCAINATPANPAFSITSASSVFITLRNFTVFVDAAATKGHCFFISGNTFNPQVTTLENIRVFNFVGSGKDQTGASMDAYGIYAYGVNSINLNQVNIQNCSGGIYLDDISKAAISESVIDDNDHYGLYINNSSDIRCFGGVTFNGNAQTSGEAQIYITGTTQSVSVVDCRLKGSAGSQVFVNSSVSVVNVKNNDMELYSTTDSAVLILAGSKTVNIEGNYFKFIGQTVTYTKAAVEISRVVSGAAFAYRIVGNLITVGGNDTLTNGIHVNPTSGIARSIVIENNNIGGGGVASVVTNAINLAQTGSYVRVSNNSIGVNGNGTVTNGIVIGASHDYTVLMGNSFEGAFVTTPITNNGTNTQYLGQV